MFKNIKLLKELKNQSYEIELDDDADYTNERNEALIYVNANQTSEIVSKFSAGEDLIINSELSSYLEEKVDYLDIKYPINIKINNAKDFDKNEKDKVKLAIRNKFTQKVSEVNEKLYTNKIECIMLTILSLLFLVGYIACRLIPNGIVGEIVGEIVLIISWVFVWRLVESIVFERRQMRKEAIKYYRLLNARIEFFN